ncbi:MAG: VWA domain-containing protein [Planctomycetes bacterium]|nr:VWA domain-containing protein [Planctomycetota bacterium]
MALIDSQLLLLSAATSPPEGGEVRELVAYELSRLGQFDEPRLFWTVLGALLVIAVAYVIWLYHRERGPLSRPLRLLLPGLRLLAIAGAVMFFLGLEKRVDRQIVIDSVVAILVDTSQSMSVEDEINDDKKAVTRSEAVLQMLADSPLIKTLRQQHEVSLSVFGEKTRPLFRWRRQQATETDDTATDWVEQLQPQGIETRLGDAIQETLQRDEGHPLAGVILISDGGQNRGLEPLSLGRGSAIGEGSQSFRVPLYPVGVGSAAPRRNLRVQKLSVPSRVYPEDSVTVSALIRGEGFAGRTVVVELFARDAGTPSAVANSIGQQKITFDTDEQVIPIEFQFEPAEVGRLLMEVRIAAPTDDQYADDNRREAEMNIVEMQTRVLLVASGATRDYRFLRNQLRRDRHATVDILLQGVQPGISQDADQLLDEFPRTKEDLYPYDCLVAFDPDWTLLDAQQAELLESWVAEEAGGLIVVAGPVHTARWVQNPELGKIRALYPVEFQRRLTLLDDGLYGSKTAWPILFSREGEESDHLWLADSASESRLLWSEFKGVFGCYSVKGLKPGARVLARYSDPDAGLSVERPIYWAEHFYGGGRVFYMGSGELWRLRSLDPRYFEVLTTRLIRHVSQGRLLRESSHGRLLVERDEYSVGDEVIVRAQLSTASREPLLVDRVTARVIDPRGTGQNLTLTTDANRPGNFVGQFHVRKEGSYRIELPVPGVLDEQLVRRIQVTVPSLEFNQTRRNDALLAAIASQSGGQYYPTLALALNGRSGLVPVAEQIESRAERKTLRGTPDEDFTEQWNRILLAVICGALGLEWFLRRLMRLA